MLSLYFAVIVMIVINVVIWFIDEARIKNIKKVFDQRLKKLEYSADRLSTRVNGQHYGIVALDDHFDEVVETIQLLLDHFELELRPQSLTKKHLRKKKK